MKHVISRLEEEFPDHKFDIADKMLYIDGKKASIQYQRMNESMNLDIELKKLAEEALIDVLVNEVNKYLIFYNQQA